jgi:hypothetical protein
MIINPHRLARYNFLYWFKARARRGRAPPLRRGLPPVCAPAGRARRRARGCGHEMGDTLLGWGGRLHGFRQPLWGEPLRSWPQRRALRAGPLTARLAISLRGHDHSPQSRSADLLLTLRLTFRPILQ